MFLSLRDLTFARGRFALMGSVVALIAVLCVFLTGMATGLVRDGVSSLQSMPVSHFAFESGVKSDLFSRSVVEQSAWQGWARAPGVRAATPYGNSLVHATSDRGTKVDLALFGVVPGSFIAPSPTSGSALGASDNGVLVSRKILDAGVKVGDTLVVDRVGTRLPVVGTVGTLAFGHVGVVYTPLRTWQQVQYGLPGAVPESAYERATAVALRLSRGADIAALDARFGTTTQTRQKSYGASPGYGPEQATMMMIRVFLYLISALVVGAFFTVWTVQRKQEIALLKALGAATGYLVRDVGAQVLIVLVSATVVGGLAGVGLGALVGKGMPFWLQPGPVISSLLLLVGLGVVGALVTLRRITAVDPLIALGTNR